MTFSIQKPRLFKKWQKLSQEHYPDFRLAGIVRISPTHKKQDAPKNSMKDQKQWSAPRAIMGNE